eukprot:COSAG02_NODE_4265_length_5572_cov_3.251416_10_plen_281_part_00
MLTFGKYTRTISSSFSFRLSALLSVSAVEDGKDVDEKVDDVQVDVQRSEHIFVDFKCVLCVLASNNQLSVENYVSTEDQAAEPCVHVLDPLRLVERRKERTDETTHNQGEEPGIEVGAHTSEVDFREACEACQPGRDEGRHCGCETNGGRVHEQASNAEHHRLAHREGEQREVVGRVLPRAFLAADDTADENDGHDHAKLEHGLQRCRRHVAPAARAQVTLACGRSAPMSSGVEVHAVGHIPESRVTIITRLCRVHPAERHLHWLDEDEDKDHPCPNTLR